MPTARGSWRRVGKAEVDMEVDAEVVEEKVEVQQCPRCAEVGEELARRK